MKSMSMFWLYCTSDNREASTNFLASYATEYFSPLLVLSESMFHSKRFQCLQLGGVYDPTTVNVEYSFN